MVKTPATPEDWARCLADQGASPELIDAARAAADRQAAAAAEVALDPQQAVTADGFQHLLRVEAKKRAARQNAAPPRSTPRPPDAAPPGETLGASLEAISALYRSGAVSALELVDAHLAGLETTGRALNAVARLEAADARETAAALDARRAHGETLGSLAGAPLAHKDLYGRAGWRLEAGSKIFQGNIAAETGPAIAGLDAADALDLGRLNTVEFAFGPDGRNVHTGAVLNPWNREHVTGGSSSGSGASVAAGLVPAALGSDTGGSIRLPAAACGVVGLKPTAGVIGRSGVWPLSGALDTVGPLARTVRDAALLVEAMAGVDPKDAQSIDLGAVDLMSSIEDGLGELKIGVVEAYFFDGLDEEIASALDAARRVFEAEGAVVSTQTLPGVEVANRLNSLIIGAEVAAQQRTWLATRASDYGAPTLGRMASGLFLPAGAYAAALMRRASFLKETLDGALSAVDALLLPVWPFETPPIEDADAPPLGRSEETGRCTRPINFLGLPAVALPCAVSANGLPIGFQLVGRPFDEAVVLRAARGYERARRFAEDHQPAIRAG